jgi:hypothetical protein
LVDATCGRYRKDVTVTDPARRHDSPTVLLSVTPQLLSDAIERLLANVPCRILLPDTNGLDAPPHVSVAVVNGDMPPTVEADLVIRVTDEPQLQTATGIRSLDDLLTAVGRAVGGRSIAS